MIIIIALPPNVVSEDTRMDRLFVDQNVSRILGDPVARLVYEVFIYS
jgi:hypothetical protein